MRVVHVVTQIGTYGGERFVPALARAQRAAGLDVTIVTLSPSASIDDGVPIHAVARNGRRPGQTLSFFSHLVGTMRALRPDIVHTHLAYGKTWGRLAAMLAGRVPIVHTEHANDFGGSHAYRYLGRLLHARTSRIVALSRAHADRIARYEGVASEKIAVIPNGIEQRGPHADRDTARKRFGLSETDRLVLFLGRLDDVKRPRLAVEAFASLDAELHARLWIAGDGPLRGAVAETARERGLGDRVSLLGYRSDTSALLAAADAVLNTSRTEAMPLSVIEARCEGVPIASTPWPGADELLEAGGTLAADDSPAAVAQALNVAVRTGRATDAERALARESFSIERAAAAHAALYHSITGETS